MRFTRIPVDTFEKLQMGAGVFLSTFDPSTGEVAEEKLIGATTGGATFSATPTFSDQGEDIDNCPKNTKELKQLDAWEARMSGTMLTIDEAGVKRILSAADAEGNKITPRNDLKLDDFTDLWWVGDYGAEGEGMMAIHIMNALSTGGFQFRSTDRAKGQFSFDYLAHYSIDAQDTVPFEIYVQAAS